MSLQTLKEQLKPPFHRGQGKGDGCNYKIYGTESSYPLLQCNDYIFQTKKGGSLFRLFNEYVDWVVTAMNEKWERDFGEPLRWLIKGDGFNVDPYLVCPKCNEEPRLYWDGENVDALSEFNYCPHCGQRLLPPEGEREKQ
jgi:DNA-directed RNA polymerase subunit RPC12/RpoP